MKKIFNSRQTWPLAALKCACFFAVCFVLIAPGKMSSRAPAAPMAQPQQSHIVNNGDFSEWLNAAPTGWTLGSGATYQRDNAMTYSSRQSLKAAQVDSEEKLPSARLQQEIRLQPHAKYRMSLAMAKHGTGTVIIRVQPLTNGAVSANTLAALDWSSGWNWYFPWSSLSLEFEAGEQSAYRLTIQSYGKTGDPIWIDNVAVNPAANIAAVSTPQQASGFRLYSQSTLLPEDGSTLPASARPLTDVFVSGTRGDFSPAFVGLHADAPLREVQLVTAVAPANAAGATIPPENITIRMMSEQALLPLSRPRPAAPGENLGWHVTIRIPETSSPGIYAGQLAVVVEGKTVSLIPYSVRVEDFRLPAPDIPLFVYHSEDYFPSGNFLTRELRETYYRDMKEHGMNTVTMYNTPDIDGTEIDFNRDYRQLLTGAQLEEKKKKRNLTDADLQERSLFGLNQTMQLAMKSGLVSRQQPVLWLVTKQGRYGWGDMPAPALTKSLREWNSHPDWPRPLLYVLDEPDGHPDRIAAARKALDKIKGLGLPVKTVTAAVAVKELGRDYDVWIQAEADTTAEMAQQAKRDGAELWTYNCNMPTSNGPFTRAFYGFWAYRSQVRGIGLWAYYDAGNWFADEAGTVHGRNGPADLSRICPSPTGPIPTISWESTREGVTDYRYAMLFDQLIRETEEKAARLETESKKVLSQAAIDALNAPAKTKPAQAVSAKEENATQQYRQSQQLKAVGAMAHKARLKLITSIPADAMALLKDAPWSTEYGKFIPPIGFGDPLLAAEHKRNSVRAYVRYLRSSLETADKS